MLLAAIADVRVDWLNVTLAVIGIVVAHRAANLMNDLADTEVGNDTADYPRAPYAPHPILSGLVTKRQILGGILLCEVLELAILVTLIWRQSWWVAAFALGGLLLSWAYAARRAAAAAEKARSRRARRVRDVGPLMMGGVYYAGTGDLPWQVLATAAG